MPDSNTVVLTSSYIEAVSYIDSSLNITSGEDYELPPSIVRSGYEWKITLQADRKGSDAVADAFNTTVGGAIHEYAPDQPGTDAQPDSLNFFFGVRITWNVGGLRVTDEVYLGQGHNITGNNWWIGANEIVASGVPNYLVISDDIIREIFHLSGSTNMIVFTPTT
jgi:hypothetical protein